MGSYEIICKANVKTVDTPNDYPKCKCGGDFKLQVYTNRSGVHQLTAAICKSCQESFCIYDVQDGYKSIPKGQKARLTNPN